MHNKIRIRFFLQGLIRALQHCSPFFRGPELFNTCRELRQRLLNTVFNKAVPVMHTVRSSVVVLNGFFFHRGIRNEKLCKVNDFHVFVLLIKR